MSQPPQLEPEVKVPCEVYSRIVGYLRPVSNWNVAKQHEFEQRKTFRLPREVEATVSVDENQR